jgi:hypothetical protein
MDNPPIVVKYGKFTVVYDGDIEPILIELELSPVVNNGIFIDDIPPLEKFKVPVAVVKFGKLTIDKLIADEIPILPDCNDGKFNVNKIGEVMIRDP